RHLAKAGVQGWRWYPAALDSRFRGNDELNYVTTPRPLAQAVGVGSGLELRRDLLRDLGPPFLHRLEARQLAATGLGLAEELVLRLVEIDFEAAGLRHVPRGVAEHLDAVAFGIVEINRPGIAVSDRTDCPVAGFPHLA